LPQDDPKTQTFPYLPFSFAGLLLDVDFFEAQAILITSVSLYKLNG
jgi:hypothetical protein